MPDNSDWTAETARPLERRSLPGKRRESALSKRRSLILTPAAFKQAVIKYSRRQVRDGRPFSLAVLSILEYRHVRETLGQQAAEQLNHLGQDVCLRNLRDADRLCVVPDGHLLLLLPETEPAGAKRTVERLSQLMATAKTHYRHQPLHASCSYELVSSGQAGSDPEALLAAIGYELDDKDGLCHTGTAGFRPGIVGGRQDTFAGPCAAWLERYGELSQRGESLAGEHLRVTMLTARDLWAGGIKVKIKMMEGREADTRFDTSSVELLSRRARVLQSIDHPGVLGVLDYHVRERRILYLVQESVEGPSLENLLEDGSVIDFDTVLEWGSQICNILIYLQNLVPPVVPPLLEGRHFVVHPSAHLMLVDYEVPYLFPNWYQLCQLSDQEAQAASQGRPIAAYGSIMRSFAQLMQQILVKSPPAQKRLSGLFARLTLAKVPPELNTVYKVRSALKEIADVERLGLLAK